jgi:hypothetical protein
MLAGYAGMCLSDLPALLFFALPHTCIWIPPDSAASESSACCPLRGVHYVPLLPRCVMLAGYAGMCPSDLPVFFSFALPHTCIWIPPDSAAGERLALLPAMCRMSYALVAMMCVAGWPCWHVPL